MRISSTGNNNSIQNTKKAKKTSSSNNVSFGSLLDAAETSETSPSAPVTEAQSVSTVDSMLVLQEVSEDDLQKKKAVKQAGMTLSALEKLRDALLMGRLPEHLLNEMQRIVDTQRALTTNPLLNQVLDDIELRAAVELAKLEMHLKR